MQKELLLGSHYVGQEALIRFYVLHVIVLPVITTVLLGVHFWRIRKDGGLARPVAADDPSFAGTSALESTGHSGDGQKASIKTFGLMGLMKGTTPQVNREMRNTIPTWPGVLYVIAAATMITVLAMFLLGAFFDAPLAEMADAAVPENPAKAP